MKIEQRVDTLNTTRVSHDNRLALIWPGYKDGRDWWLYAPGNRVNGDIYEAGKWCEDYLDALAKATDYVTGCSQTIPPSSGYALGYAAPATHTDQPAASPQSCRAGVPASAARP